MKNLTSTELTDWLTDLDIYKGWTGVITHLEDKDWLTFYETTTNLDFLEWLISRSFWYKTDCTISSEVIQYQKYYVDQILHMTNLSGNYNSYARYAYELFSGRSYTLGEIRRSVNTALSHGNNKIQPDYDSQLTYFKELFTSDDILALYGMCSDVISTKINVSYYKQFIAYLRKIYNHILVSVFRYVNK